MEIPDVFLPVTRHPHPASFYHFLRSPSITESLGVRKILVRKIWFNPPPPRKVPKTRKNCTNQQRILKIDTFPGGGKKRLYGQNDFMDIWAFLIHYEADVVL